MYKLITILCIFFSQAASSGDLTLVAKDSVNGEEISFIISSNLEIETIANDLAKDSVNPLELDIFNNDGVSILKKPISLPRAISRGGEGGTE